MSLAEDSVQWLIYPAIASQAAAQLPVKQTQILFSLHLDLLCAEHRLFIS